MTDGNRPTSSKLRDWGVLAALLVIAAGGTMLMREHREAADAELAVHLAAAARPGDIEMFTTRTCPYCSRARSWLDAHRVPYTECNTDASAACAERFSRLGAVGVPTFLVRGQVQTGFQPQRLARALGLDPDLIQSR